jgi:hypothetical protein
MASVDTPSRNTIPLIHTGTGTWGIEGTSPDEEILRVGVGSAPG